MIEILVHGKIPVTLYSNTLIFRDTSKSFQPNGDILKTITIYIFNVGHSNLQDRKIIRELAEEMNIDIRNIGRKSPRERSIVELVISPAIMALGVSTRFLSYDPNELCDILKFLLQKNQAGKNSIIFDEEIVARVDKISEYKSISKKKQKQL